MSGHLTIALADCTDQLAVAGGKSVGLARLMKHGFPVPDGFAVTTHTFREAVVAAGIDERVQTILTASGLTVAERSEQVQALFTPRILSAEVADAITSAYAALCGGEAAPVAVRSSATAEDLADASFAGQQDTYLWIEGADAVLRKVVACWASLYTARAIEYRARLGGHGSLHGEVAEELAMGVVVQRMVDADAAGVMMTLDPASGDRSAIYIESGPGLGESIVRGEVSPDRFTLDRDLLTIRSSEVGHKATMWVPSSEHGESIRVDVPRERQDAPSLSDEEAVAVAALGRRVDEAFGAPMDVEWAIGPGPDGPRTLQVLQARPETVWSSRADGAAASTAERDDWDTLDSPSADHLHWTTANLGEACPGVLTPLSWDVWAPVVEGSARTAGHAIGALSRAESRVPEDVEQRYLRIFKGRPAMQLEFMATLGDRMPGTTGKQTIEGLFGNAPEDMEFAPTRRRYAAVAWRLPTSFLTIPRRIHRLAEETDVWWRERLAELAGADLGHAVAILADARTHLRHAVDIQSVLNLASIQVTWDALRGVIDAAGVGDEAVLSGFGGPEMEVVHDISGLAHGDLDLDTFLARHGFHGPLEGELSSVVWREEPTPVLRLLDGYRGKGRIDTAAQDAQKAVELAAMQEQVLAALPRRKRRGARLVLNLAARRLTQRGIPKRAFLQSFDVARAAARRIGALLAADGVLVAAEDVFYLTCDEIASLDVPAGARHRDVHGLISWRKARRAEYQARTYPSEWTGTPEPIKPQSVGGDAGVIEALGVSSGIVEGVVKLVLDPGNADVQPGEILVAPTTDPSWCSLMFVSAGLVVDIGGALSHAAVVARELGIPCVVNTRTGTQQLRTGDRVRVDGVLGTVEVLERATVPALVEQGVAS